MSAPAGKGEEVLRLSPRGTFLRELLRWEGKVEELRHGFLVEVPVEQEELAAEPRPALDATRRIPRKALLFLSRSREVRSARTFSLALPEGRDELMVGREDGCDIVLPPDTVSKRHAALHHRGGLDYEVEDLDSSNGTWLHGKPLIPRVRHPVKPLNMLQFASYRTLFVPPASLAPLLKRLGGEAKATCRVATREREEEEGLEGTSIIASGLVSGPMSLREAQRRAEEDPEAAHRYLVVTPRLVFRLDGRREGRGELLVGRSGDGLDLVIEDCRVSRTHAAFETRGGGRWFVKDLGSSNGTTVGGKRIPAERPFRLHAGDTVSFGGFSMTFADARSL